MATENIFWIEKTPETTKTWNHDKLTDMFSQCKCYYAIIKFPGVKLVYQSALKKQENVEIEF